MLFNKINWFLPQTFSSFLFLLWINRLLCLESNALSAWRRVGLSSGSKIVSEKGNVPSVLPVTQRMNCFLISNLGTTCYHRTVVKCHGRVYWATVTSSGVTEWPGEGYGAWDTNSSTLWLVLVTEAWLKQVANGESLIMIITKTFRTFLNLKLQSSHFPWLNKPQVLYTYIHTAYILID